MWRLNTISLQGVMQFYTYFYDEANDLDTRKHNALRFMAFCTPPVKNVIVFNVEALANFLILYK